MTVKDLTGQRYGKLVVIGKDTTTPKNYWIVKCDCGNTKSIFRGHLTANRIDNCGCITLEKRSKKNKTHGETNTRLFKIWNGMINRCSNKNNNSYQKYGGRGIIVCEEWHKYIKFRDWALSHGYNDTLTIDRIDVNGNYCPENCRWATNKQQANNRRNTRYFTYKNETHTISEWAEILNINIETLQTRINYKWSMNKIKNTPVKKYRARNKTATGYKKKSKNTKRRLNS